MIYDIAKAIALLHEWRNIDKQNVIYTTNGCFDLLHVGHIKLIKAMRDDLRRHSIIHYDVNDRIVHAQIVVGVNCDESVHRTKGDGRPIIPQDQRAVLVDAIRYVDVVFIFDDLTPVEWLKQLKPDKHFKAGYQIDDVPEVDVINAYGGELVLLDKLADVSTTQIIERIKAMTMAKKIRKCPVCGKTGKIYDSYCMYCGATMCGKLRIRLEKIYDKQKAENELYCSKCGALR